jgi:hypothetical protein
MNEGYHYCTVKDCQVEIPRSLLMCKPHWTMVSQKLKNAVNRTWRAFGLSSPRLRGEAYSPQGRADTLREYQEARKAAIAFVEALQAGAPV